MKKRQTKPQTTKELVEEWYKPKEGTTTELLDNWEEELEKATYKTLAGTTLPVISPHTGEKGRAELRRFIQRLLKAKDAECEEKSRKQNKTAALDEDYRRLNDFGKRVLREMEKYYGSNRRPKPHKLVDKEEEE